MRKILLTLVLIFVGWGVTKAQSPENHPLKLRVGTYNVGHFNEGKLGGYQGNDVQIELQRWRDWIGEQSLDIFALNEWNRFFDKDSTIHAQQLLLDPLYNNVYWGAENKWIYNGIATNYTLTNIRQVDLSGQYYAIVGDLKINNKIITVMSTHIPWQKDTHEAGVKAMIDEMKKYEYLICMGDMNSFDRTQLGFAEAGFNIANGGYQGFKCTAPASKAKGRKDGLHIDNIITSKNIKIMNVSAPENSLTARDHFPIVADIVITW